MAIENVFQTLFSKARNRIFMETHHISEKHLPAVFQTAEVSLGITCFLIQVISSSVPGHVHSADMITCLIESGDHFFITRDIFRHSVAYLYNAFDNGS